MWFVVQQLLPCELSEFFHQPMSAHKQVKSLLNLLIAQSVPPRVTLEEYAVQLPNLPQPLLMAMCVTGLLAFHQSHPC